MHKCWREGMLAVLFVSALAGPEPAAGQAATPRTDDFRVWAAISGSDESSDFETFLRVYPHSLLAPLAKSRLSAIQQRGLSASQARVEGGRLFRYRNSSVPTEETGVPLQGGRMHVRLDAPTRENAASVPIDDAKLMAMCADENGCAVSLGIVGWRYNDIAFEAPWVNASCRLHIRERDGQRHWILQSSCYQLYAVHGEDDKGRLKWNEKSPGSFVPYWSGFAGIDGTDKLPNGNGDRRFVLYTGSCVFAEAPHDPESKGQSGLLPDTRPGFYLIAGTPAWGGENYPAGNLWPQSAAGRACELVIED